MKDILFGNNNRRIIKRLSARYFKAAKSRNVMAVLAISLTTALFSAIFTLGSGLVDTIQDQNIRRSGGDGQVVLNSISDEVYRDIQGNALIDRIAYTKVVSYRLKNPGLEKWRSELWYMDDTALEFARYEPTTGHKPEAGDEIMADTRTLQALGVPAKVGETVSLTYEIKGREYTTDFVLCGFWETDSLSRVGRLIVSKAFMDSRPDILAYTYPEDNDYSGAVVSYLTFKGGGNLSTKLHRLLSETGYTCDTMGGSPESGNYIIARISPVYQGGGILENPSMLICGIAGILLIVVTGYLIIYNIFQISVVQDIQSYGQLKALGTTKKQMKSLINRQALALSLPGIPAGLLTGFFTGRALVPFLMDGTVYTADAGIKVTMNPLIFIGSAAFSLFTVLISVRKPANIAGMVSPVEAVKYTGNDTTAFAGRGPAGKRRMQGARVDRMALANLARNRKRTVLSVVSMTLSLVLFHAVFTISQGFDMDKYIAKFVNTDFIISTADYFQFRFETSQNDLSEAFVSAVEQNSHFEDGGRLYTTRMLEEVFSVEGKAFAGPNVDENGNPLVDLYGADDFLLNRMEVIEGTLDWEAFKTGRYVLLGVGRDDQGNIIDNPNASAGDTVLFYHSTVNGLSSSVDNSFPLTITAKVRTNENTDTTRSTGAARFYMPAEQFLPLCGSPHLVSFPFNVKDGTETEMGAFLASYVEEFEPDMDFDSKETYLNSFAGLTSLIVTIGGTLSAMIGLIGIANFVNSVLTGMIARRKEFAMLQSIGMTGRQLKRMLSYEGLYYAVLTILSSAVLGTLFSMIIVRGIASGIWFFTYQFIVWPLLVAAPFLIVLAAAIPVLLYRQVAKASIVQRLRQN